MVIDLHTHFRVERETVGDVIRDLHTTLGTGSDHGELLVLAVHLHVHVTRMWLNAAEAPTDLRRRTVFLARRLAHEHGAATVLGMAAFGVADVLAGGGAFELAQAELDGITVPATMTDHWVGYGRALARLRGRHDDAVRALRRAETIHPHRVQRDPFVHEVIGELLTRTRHESPTGRELRRMAYRAGLPV